jgi:hypothetical protein
MACPTCTLLKALLESMGVETDDAQKISQTRTVKRADKAIKKKVKRKASAASKRYGRAFKKLAPKYKKKSGGWKKDGFKRCAAAARRAAKR